MPKRLVNGMWMHYINGGGGTYKNPTHHMKEVSRVSTVVISENAKNVAAEVLEKVKADEAKQAAKKPRGERRNGPVRSNRNTPCAGGCGKMMTGPKLLSNEGPRTCIKCLREQRKQVKFVANLVAPGGVKFTLQVDGNEERFMRQLLAHGVTVTSVEPMK